MALAYQQIFAFSLAAGSTLYTPYTVPASTKVIGQILVANTSTTNNRTFRLAIVSGGGTAIAEDYLAYDITLVPGEIWQVTGLTLNAADEIKVRGDASSSSEGTGIIFQMYGEKIS